MTHANIPLLLFAKAPIAGKVKTRLTSHCSAQQAADIAELLMQASIEKAVSAWPGPVYLSVSLGKDHPFIMKMQRHYSIKIKQQCEGDLGEKMRHALNEAGYPAAIVGCDAPHIKPSTLEFAYLALQKGQNVIGPAVDGGYYFIGLSQKVDSLFSNKPWGGNQVFRETMLSAENAGLEIGQLDPLNDVDEWSDLLELAQTDSVLLNYLVRKQLI